MNGWDEIIAAVGVIVMGAIGVFVGCFIALPGECAIVFALAALAAVVAGKKDKEA